MLLDACFRLAQVCLIFFSVYSNAHFLRKAGSKPAVKKATRVPSVHDTLQLRAQSRSVEFANKVVPAKIVRPENDGNPYWNYFKQVWGNAPFLEANYRLWLSGGLKNFKVGQHSQKFQTTKALPAFLHYYGTDYDPLVDPPYPSEEALYADTKEALASPSEAESKPEESLSDCSQAFGPKALGYKRPCTVNKVRAASFSKEKHLYKVNEVIGKNTWWSGQDRTAGSSRGSTLYTHETLPPKDKPYDMKQATKPYIALDNRWIANDKAKDRIKAPKEPEAPKPHPVGFSHSKPDAAATSEAAPGR
eukprot:g5568.t1